MQIALLFLLTTFVSSNAIPDDQKPPMSRIPKPDRRFHVYVLPVGQGSGTIVQCPNGTLSVVDMGTSSNPSAGFWFEANIRNFIDGNFNLVRNIILTHRDRDHYRFLPGAFTKNDSLTGLRNIYISLTLSLMPEAVKTWVEDIDAEDKVRVFNKGKVCGSSSDPHVDCETIDLCPQDREISVKVLSVNAGQLCNPRNTNTDSIVVQITYGQFSIQLNGDFEDCTPSANEVGPLRQMVNYYNTTLQSTVYMLAHHGAENKANKEVILNAVQSKAIFASSDPGFRYNHPRCNIINAFLNDVGTLCRPEVTDSSNQSYCGEHPYPYPELQLPEKLQESYTCGTSPTTKETFSSNHAIYTTAPTSDKINLIHIVTDGTKWGFVNNITPKIGTTPRPSYTSTTNKKRTATAPTGGPPTKRPRTTASYRGLLELLERNIEEEIHQYDKARRIEAEMYEKKSHGRLFDY